MAFVLIGHAMPVYRACFTSGHRSGWLTRACGQGKWRWSGEQRVAKQRKTINGSVEMKTSVKTERASENNVTHSLPVSLKEIL